VSATRPITVAAAALAAAALVSPLSAGAATGDEQRLSELWKAPNAWVLAGPGSDTSRTRAANMLLRSHPDLVGGRFSHLRRLIGSPIKIARRSGTWQYRVSVRALPDDGSCTRYLMVVPQRRYRIGGFQMTSERCSDGSPGRPLPKK
jgi:hypothetical protein